jgi:hypothetical protein
MVIFDTKKWKVSPAGKQFSVNGIKLNPGYTNFSGEWADGKNRVFYTENN